MQKLMNAVGEMSVTFHRAFDMCSNPKEALEQIIGLGIDRSLLPDKKRPPKRVSLF